MWQLSFLVFITTKAAPVSLEQVLACLTLVELAVVGHGYGGNYQGHVFLSVVLSVTLPDRHLPQSLTVGTVQIRIGWWLSR